MNDEELTRWLEGLAALTKWPFSTSDQEMFFTPMDAEFGELKLSVRRARYTRNVLLYLVVPTFEYQQYRFDGASILFTELEPRFRLSTTAKRMTQTLEAESTREVIREALKPLERGKRLSEVFAGLDVKAPSLLGGGHGCVEPGMEFQILRQSNGYRIRLQIRSLDFETARAVIDLVQSSRSGQGQTSAR